MAKRISLLSFIFIYASLFGPLAWGADPRDYGCAGDGATDDTIRFRNAATAAAGKVLFIPAGYTFVVAGIDISANTVVTGGGTLKLKALTNYIGSPILNITGHKVVIEGITLDGNKARQSASGFSDSYDTGANKTGRAYRCAIKADGAGEDLIVRNCIFKNTFGAAIAARYVNKVTVSDNRFEGLNFEAVVLYSSSEKVFGGGGSGHNILGNTVYNVDSGNRGGAPNGNAFVLSDVRRAVVADNRAANIGRTLVKLENCEDVVVRNNTFINSLDKYAGIQTQNGARRITIADNYIKDAGIGIQVGGVRELSNVTISGNTIDNTTNASIPDGIQIVDKVVNSQVSGNVIRNQGRAGIIVPNAGAGLVVAGNVINGLLGTSYWGYAIGPADNTATVVFKDNFSQNSAGVADRGVAVDEGVLFVMPAKGKKFAFLEISGNVLITRSDRPGGRAIGMTTVGMVDKAIVHDNYTDGRIEYYDKNVASYNNYPVGKTRTGGAGNFAEAVYHGAGGRKFRFANAAPRSTCTVGEIVFNSGTDHVILWKCTNAHGSWKPMMGTWDNGAAHMIN